MATVSAACQPSLGSQVCTSTKLRISLAAARQHENLANFLCQQRFSDDQSLATHTGCYGPDSSTGSPSSSAARALQRPELFSESAASSAAARSRPQATLTSSRQRGFGYGTNPARPIHGLSCTVQRCPRGRLCVLHTDLAPRSTVS